PDNIWSRAEALSWMFFEQYSDEPYVAVARSYLAYAPKEELKKREHLLHEWHAKGNAALAVMENHIRKRDWLAGTRYSVSDFALFGYTRTAQAKAVSNSLNISQSPAGSSAFASNRVTFRVRNAGEASACQKACETLYPRRLRPREPEKIMRAGRCTSGAESSV